MIVVIDVGRFLMSVGLAMFVLVLVGWFFCD